MSRVAVVQRSDQRLKDSDGAVISAAVAPGFEVVRSRDVPVRVFGRFVVVEAGVDEEPQGISRNSAAICRLEFQIARCVVGGITPVDQQ